MTVAVTGWWENASKTLSTMFKVSLLSELNMAARKAVAAEQINVIVESRNCSCDTSQAN